MEGAREGAEVNIEDMVEGEGEEQDRNPMDNTENPHSRLPSGQATGHRQHAARHALPHAITPAPRRTHPVMARVECCTTALSYYYYAVVQ